MSFYEGQLKQHICYSFILLIVISHMGFYPYRIAFQFFKNASNFPKFDDPNMFSPQIQQAPGPNFRWVGKSLGLCQLFEKDR